MPNLEQIEFQTTEAGQTQNDKLRAIFLGRPNEWIPMPELGELIGAYAVHSRIADLRKTGMTIETHVEGRRPRKSYYKYVPHDANPITPPR